MLITLGDAQRSIIRTCFSICHFLTFIKLISIRLNIIWECVGYQLFFILLYIHALYFLVDGLILGTKGLNSNAYTWFNWLVYAVSNILTTYNHLMAIIAINTQLTFQFILGKHLIQGWLRWWLISLFIYNFYLNYIQFLLQKLVTLIIEH